MNLNKTAKQLQALFQETNKSVKGNWIAPETDDIVKILRDNLSGGVGHHEQRATGISQSAVSKIKNHRCWRSYVVV